jgi:hypothetical protein
MFYVSLNRPKGAYQLPKIKFSCCAYIICFITARKFKVLTFPLLLDHSSFLTIMQSTPGVDKFSLRISGTSSWFNQPIPSYGPNKSRKHKQTDISCNSLPSVGRLIKHAGCFYLSATIAGVTRRTYLAQSSSNPSWEDPLTL